MIETIFVSVKSENGAIIGAEAHKTKDGCVLGVLLDIDGRTIIDDEEGKQIGKILETSHKYDCEDGIGYRILEVALRK